MTDKQMHALYTDALQQDREIFVNDWTLSSMFAADPEATVDLALAEELGKLWDVANAPFDRLLQLMGLTITQCHLRFCIPYRTVQDWSRGERRPPDYIRLLLAEAIGFLRIRSRDTAET